MIQKSLDEDLQVEPIYGLRLEYILFYLIETYQQMRRLLYVN